MRRERGRAVDHAEPRAQNGDEGDLAAGDHVELADTDGRFDLDLLHRHVAGGLIAHQHGDLVGQLAELLGTGVLVAQERDLVLDERMVHNKRL